MHGTNTASLDVLCSTQEVLAEMRDLLAVRGDQLSGTDEEVTEMRALFNAAKGLKQIVECKIDAHRRAQ